MAKTKKSKKGKSTPSISLNGTIISTVAFKISCVLITCVFCIQIATVFYYDGLVESFGTKEIRPFLHKIFKKFPNKKAQQAAARKLDHSSSHQGKKQNAEDVFTYAGPVVPYLPAHQPIPNGHDLMQDVMEGKPTLGGIVHICTSFLIELHHKFKEMADGDTNNQKKHENGLYFQDEVLTAYMDLAEKYLLSFDEKYRGKPIFPIRDDDSVFISLAAYREQLLAQTLREAFGKATNPDKIFIGAVIQNCFGIDATCRTGVEVVGKNAKGRPITKVSDRPPDVNGIEEFCGPDSDYKKYCESGQVRVMYVNETESLGPAVARYFASKLWVGEQYFMQIDAHLQFAHNWDTKYIEDMKLAKSYPKVVLSSYPPGFSQNSEHVGETAGAKLCNCVFSPSDVEHHIIRINSGGNYRLNAVRPMQTAYIAAGFFFTGAEWLTDVPFDPLLPWCFMGEEIALSMRSWTNGWNIYAPRMNNIAHQYRPGRMGVPKFWETVGRVFHQPGPGFNTLLQVKSIQRVKNLVGYAESTDEIIMLQGEDRVLLAKEHYGCGTVRSKEEYLELTKIDVEKRTCGAIPWCINGELE